MVDIATLGIRVDSRDVKRAEGDLDRFTGTAGRAERAAAGIGAAMRTAMGMAAGAFATVNVVSTLRGFESAMAAVGAVSQATASDMAAMRGMAQQLGAETKFSATDAANALAQLTASGYSAKQAMSALPGTLDLAAVGSMNLEQAADAASDILQQFRLDVEDTNRVVDVLAKQHTQSSSSVAMTVQAMQGAGVAARALGLDVETTSAAIGALAEAGIKGSQGGTALNAVLSRLIDPTKAARQALASYNLSAADMDVGTRGLIPVLRDLEEANIDLATANELVGLEHGKSLISLANNVDAVEQFTAANRAAGGEARRLAKYISDNLDGSFQSLGSAVEGLILKLGENGLTSGIRGTVEAFTALVRGITAMPDLGAVATGFGLVAAGTLAMASPLVAGAAAITGLAAGVAYLYQNWGTFAASFPGLAGVISGAVGGIRSALGYLGERASEAMSALNAAFSGEGAGALKLYLRAIVLDAKAFGADLVASFLEAGDKAVSALSEAWANFDVEQTAINGLNDTASAIERMTDIKIARPDQIASFVGGIAGEVNAIKTGAATALYEVRDAVNGFLDGFDGKAAAVGLFEDFKNSVISLGSAGGSVLRTAGYFAALTLSIVGLNNATKNVGEGSGFSRFLGQLTETTFDAAGTLLSGFAAVVDTLAGALEGLFTLKFDPFLESMDRLAEWANVDLPTYFGFIVPEEELSRSMRNIIRSHDGFVERMVYGQEEVQKSVQQATDILDKYDTGLIPIDVLAKRFEEIAKSAPAISSARDLFGMLRMEVGKVDGALDTAIDTFVDFQRVAGDGDKRSGIAGFFGVGSDLFIGGMREEVRGLASEFLSLQDALGAASGAEQQLAALTALRDTAAELADLDGAVSAPESALLANMQTRIDTLKASLAEVTSQAPEASAAVTDLSTAGDTAAESIGTIADRAATVQADVAKVSTEVESIGKAAETAKANLATLEAAAQPIATAVQGVATTANTTLDSLVSDMGAKGTAGITALATGISGGTATVTSGVETVAQAALAALATFASDMETAGRQAMEGLARGITDAASQAADAAGEASRKVIDAAKGALDIRSPSHEMAAVGEQAMAGLAQGIRDNMGESEFLSGEAGSDIITAMADGLMGGQGADTLAGGLRDIAETARLGADSLRALAGAKREIAAASQAEAAATAAATGETTKNTTATTAATTATGRAATAAGTSAVAKAKEAAATQSAIAGLIQQTERERALIGLVGEEREALLAKWRVEDALNADKLKWNEQQKQGLIDQITLTQQLAAEAEKSRGALNQVLGPIFQGLKNGDLTNVGSQIMGNARNSFLDGAQNWLTTGKGGFLGLGDAFKSLSTGFSALKAGGAGLLSGVGGIISGAMPIIGAISTAINFFKTTTKVLDQGMRLTVNGMDTMLESYKKVEKSRFFGLSKKVSTSYERISGAAADQLDFAVSEIQSAAIASAEAIGLTADAFEGFRWQAKVSGGSAEQLKSMLGEMADAFSAMGLRGFDVIRAGEGAKDALEALAASLTSVNASLETLGLRLMDVSVMSADAARDITDMLGGVDAFTSASQSYYENFYSEAERMQASVEALTATLSEAGINVVPQTVAQYRELVQAFSDAGAFEIVAKLIQAAPLFTDGVQALADVATDGIRSLYGDIGRLIETNIRSLDRALDRLNRGGEETAEAFGLALAKVRAGIMDADALDAVSTISADMFGSAAAYQHAQNSARAALENLRDDQEAQLATLDTLVSSVLTLETPLASIDDGMTQLNALVAQLVDAREGASAGIGDAGTVAEAVAAAERTATLESLQGLLKDAATSTPLQGYSVVGQNMRTDDDDNKKINTATVYFSDGSSLSRKSSTLGATALMAKAMAAAVAQGAQSQVMAAADAAQREATITSLRAQIEAMGEVPAYARGTSFARGGLSLVGEEGPELVRLPRGAQVRTASQTRADLGQGDVVAELRALRSRAESSDRDTGSRLDRLISRLEDLLDIEERREAIGMPPERIDA